MATYEIAPTLLPGQMRSMLISNVAQGDQVDIVEILGRPARRLKFIMTATTDTIQFRLNNLARLTKHVENSVDETVKIWSASPRYPTYSETGSLEHVIDDGLLIESFEIVSLTLSIGTTIDVVVW